MSTTKRLTERKNDRVIERRGDGWLYQLKNSQGQLTRSFAIDQSSAEKAYVDPNKMSARAIISNSTVDRVGDLLVPTGIRYKNYAKNPVVMWAHGLEQGLTFPIATSNDTNGMLDVTVTAQDFQAVSYFSQRQPISYQIFQLIDEGLVRATSVRETPLSEHQIFRDGRSITVVDECDLEEWSWCAIGVNPDAVAKCLHKNRLDGRPIHQSICKSLNAVSVKPKRYGTGFVESTMKEPNDPDDAGSEKDAKEPVVDSVNKPNGEPNAEQEPADQVDGDGSGMSAETESADPEQDNLFGRQIIGMAHEGVKALRRSMRDSLKSCDNKDVKNDVQALHDRLGDELPTINGMRGEHYPTSSELKDEDMGDGGEEMDEGDDIDEGSDSTMKSLLAAFRPAQHKAHAVKADIQSVLKSCKSLTTTERNRLERAISTQSKLLVESRTHKPSKPTLKSASANPDPKIEAEEAKKLELLERLTKVQSQLPKA